MGGRRRRGGVAVSGRRRVGVGTAPTVVDAAQGTLGGGERVGERRQAVAAVGQPPAGVPIDESSDVGHPRTHRGRDRRRRFLPVTAAVTAAAARGGTHSLQRRAAQPPGHSVDRHQKHRRRVDKRRAHNRCGGDQAGRQPCSPPVRERLGKRRPHCVKEHLNDRRNAAAAAAGTTATDTTSPG